MAERRKTILSRRAKTSHRVKKKPYSAPRKTSRDKIAGRIGRGLSRKAKKAGKTSTARSTKRWSQRVTRESDALDLQQGVFTLTDPEKIATSLKRSAEHSDRRKAGAYRSALSMLTFYINRAGSTLPKAQRDRLQRAKLELKHQFGRE